MKNIKKIKTHQMKEITKYDEGFFILLELKINTKHEFNFKFDLNHHLCSFTIDHDPRICILNK